MFSKVKRKQFRAISVLILILMVILIIRLFSLSVIQHDKWSKAAVSQNTKVVVEAAPRGRILDRYGRIIADNKQIFTLTFSASGLSTEQINNSAYSLVKLLESNGDKCVDNFPITISESGKFEYTYDRQKWDWLKENNMPTTFTAEQAFERLRTTYEIDAKLDRYEAAEELANSYNIYPPISVRSMTYTYDARKANFISKYGIGAYADASGNLSAEDAFKTLRQIYKIDPDLSDQEARKIFMVREEIKNLGYNKYQSSTIARNVSEKTIAYIEEMSSAFNGVDISYETIRTYPYGATLAHALGYMGSISDQQYDYYVNQRGYSANELIGKDGIEASYESVLHGVSGTTTILVDSNGDYVETLDMTEPELGGDVYLTIDIDLQEVVEDALARGIIATRDGSIFTSKYGNYRMAQAKHCESGACVVLDVVTGEVLAIASYPDYDPNIFANGISTKDWASVQSTNPRDALAPIPLYNIATSTSVQPGSTFKPITAITALQCGLNPNIKIYDTGYVEIGGRTFGCSLYNERKLNHGWENLISGIANSCNYYFYCIATGSNVTSGASLNYEKEINVEEIMQTASAFGLGQKTGIELYEATTPLASPERKMNSMKSALWNVLYYSADEYWPEKVVKNDERLRNEIDIVTGWMDENPSRAEIIKRLEEATSVFPEQIEVLADYVKYSYFNQAQWTVGDVLNIAIGQGDNAYTPLQMARYIAALGNKGELNKVSIIKGIEGEGLLDRDEPVSIDVDENDLKTVLEGMRQVTRIGTLSTIFNKFPYQVSGKTGTAEKDGYINPADEVAYVKKYFDQITYGTDVTWEDVTNEVYRLMAEEPDTFPTENDAIDRAVINVSNGKISVDKLFSFKDKYDNFAWTVTLAPTDSPRIAVVTMMVQGGTSANAGVVNREIIGYYLSNTQNVSNLDLSSKIK